eukprot:TRINITY_DN10905_c0_g1_i1.p1 TRINITY_DN10905_c0_g1~~TRINITY_DN10905_c0_g1_i1.p1  ORF type:complete len:386 (+),score=71.24 TRINITY_DN10905_c0_g1_i1:178-1335(+)
MDMPKLGLGSSHYFDNATVKFEEIKKLLDSNGLKEKMEGMKRLIALMSKGRDVSILYPDVVKNVIVKNMQIKKLVYMYIVHYAELEPEPALLAINNFQRDMASENQLMRALGLRVMSSIRLRVIVQVVVIAIKKACKDGSPYVRKAAAHAIPKIYSLDPDQLPDLLTSLEISLGDSSTMVLGSALGAFNEICPTRYDMLHKHFRKLCHVLADIDEWGQVQVVNALTRYGRHEFVNPESEKDRQRRKKREKELYNDDSNSESDQEEDEDPYGESNEMEADHRLLLQSVGPLLRSMNAAVVTSVATCFYYLAPIEEAQKVGKALTRCLRRGAEVQYVVLSNISSMAKTRPTMFEPYLLDFFIYRSDSHFVRQKKIGNLNIYCKWRKY